MTQKFSPREGWNAGEGGGGDERGEGEGRQVMDNYYNDNEVK